VAGGLLLEPPAVDRSSAVPLREPPLRNGFSGWTTSQLTDECGLTARTPAGSVRVSYSDRRASNGSTRVADRADM
jgi:hypothetical protein